MVKKCHKAGVSLQAKDEEALYKAVKHGRTSVVRYLLENGCNANAPRNLLQIASEKGYCHILKILLHFGADVHVNDEEPLIQAIAHGHTDCVKELLKHGANVHIDEDRPLLEACRKAHISIIDCLVGFGSDVNTCNGLPLLEAIDNSRNDVVNALIKHGADVCICDEAPLLKAAEKKQMRIMIELINNGADRNILRQCDNIDETTMTILKSYTRNRGIIKRLYNAIRDSFEEHDFKWQSMCSQKDPDIHLLRRQATLFGIKDATSKQKHCLCAELAIKYEHEMAFKKPIDPSLVDFSGIPIDQLPFWKIFHVEGIAFNIFDLLKMLKSNIILNPYTRNPLPINEIKSRENYLRAILTRSRYSNRNLLEEIQQSPVPTENMVLRMKLESEVWEYLLYAPSMNIILDGDDHRIDQMIDKLRNICKRKSIFDLLSNGQIDIYPMLSDDVVRDILNSTGVTKKKKLCNLLSALVNTKDEHTETRKMAVTIMLKNFTIDAQNTQDGLDDQDDDVIFGDDETTEILDTMELLHLLLINESGDNW